MRWVRLVTWSLLSLGSVGVSADSDPATLAHELAAYGPRHRESPGYHPAQAWLLATLGEVGLDRPTAFEDPVAGAWTHLTAVRHGSAASVVEVTAHYDTTAGSVGLLDNASGCAVSLSSMADVGPLPSTHATRLVLTDAEEQAARGSREWLAVRPVTELAELLTNVNLDMLGDRQSGPGVLHLARGDGSGGPPLTPAWLVDVILQTADEVGFPLVVLDRRWSLFSQLAIRLARPVRLSDASSYLTVGVPSVTLSDTSVTAPSRQPVAAAIAAERLQPARLDEWAGLLRAVVGRLDGIDRRPPADIEYLIVGGRLIDRRKLLWIGFGLWVLLVWTGLPGRWRQTSTWRRRRQGRAYLPGFAYRMVFLVTLFLYPTLATALLYSTAVGALAGSMCQVRWRQVWCALGVVPIVLFALWLATAVAAGSFVLLPTSLPPAVLALLTVASFCSWQLDPVR